MKNKRHGFQHISGKERTAWEPVLNRLGPNWSLLAKRPNARTIRSLEQKVIAQFADMAGVLFGRLTPAGIALRDAWVRSVMLKYDAQRKKTHVGRQRHSGK